MQKWQVISFQGQWAIEDISRCPSELYRVNKNGRVWRNTSRENAEHLASQLNGGQKRVREELSKTQKIMFANAKRNARPKAVISFTKCDSCGKMVKEDHTC